MKCKSVSKKSPRYIPHIFSYLNEDIDFVLNELKAKGLCRDFLAQQKDRGDRTHV
ncbi:derepression protein [Escherichia coli]